MFPYYIGIVSGLHDLGIISPGTTQLSGASAGSLIAGCYNAGIPADKIMDATMELVFLVRRDGVYSNLGPHLNTVLEKYLPDDAHERCNGNTHVAVTNVLPCMLSTPALHTCLPQPPSSFTLLESLLLAMERLSAACR